MAQQQKKRASDDGTLGTPHGKHRLDELNPDRFAKNLVMFQPSETVVEELMAKARLSIPGLTETANILKILRFDPGLGFAFARKSKFNAAAPAGEAFITFLPLNFLGIQHLALGSFNAATPDERLLTKPGERPAGIYLWCVFAPGPLAASMALLMKKLSTDQYAGVDIYARPATNDGQRFSQVLGFTRGITIGNIEAQNVWVFHREPQAPIYDTYVRGSSKNKVSVTIARTFDDITRVMAVRNAVYIGEQLCPYDEEYDGNDLAATHLLAFLGDEPIGCLRLRFFADFAKLERMAIRKEFRKSRAAFQLVHAAFKFCGKKGYRRMSAHSQTRLIDFWSRFGFQRVQGGKSFVFSDFEYVEIVADIERDPEALTIGADPYVIIRPEGRWHVPGILEESALRPVAKPSADKLH